MLPDVSQLQQAAALPRLQAQPPCTHHQLSAAPVAAQVLESVVKERTIDEYMARDTPELGLNLSDPISGGNGSGGTAGTLRRDAQPPAALQPAPQLPQELLPFELQVLEVALGEVGRAGGGGQEGAG